MKAMIQLNSYADSVHVESTKALSEGKFCKVFHLAIPVLNFFGTFFLIPVKIRVIINNLSEVLSLVCPVQESPNPQVDALEKPEGVSTPSSLK